MFDKGILSEGWLGSILPAVRPEIAESFRADASMVLGTIIGFLLLGFIVSRVSRVIWSRRIAYGQPQQQFRQQADRR